MREPIETLLFDFGGTLDANGIAWKERFCAHYRAEGLEVTADTFESSFFAADDALVGSLAPMTDLSGTVDALVTNLETELACRDAGPDTEIGNAPDADRGRRVSSRFLSDASTAFARNRPVLEALKERYKLGVVSNFYGNLQGVCHGAGLTSLFGVLVDSHCVGAQKPDPAIFHAALEALGAARETTVVIGDSLRRDGEGARQTGLRFIWMTPQDAQGIEARGAAAPVEHVVTDLSQLVTLLR